MKSVLITGASGFLGSYFVNGLKQSMNCFRLGRGDSNEIVCDLAKQVPRLPPIEMIIHNAGKAHSIPRTNEESEEFFQVNVQGTKNLLQGLSNSGSLPESFIFISSVAVYGKEQGENLDENLPLLGDTPYAKSKIIAEQLIIDWANSLGVNAVILRLPLVIGSTNMKGNLESMVLGIKRGYYFRPGDGQAKRSMVLAEDVASMIPSLWGKAGVFNLTDGVHPSLAELDHAIAQSMGKKVKKIPSNFLKVLAVIGDFIPNSPFDSRKFLKMTSSLTFDDSHARKFLKWSPSSVLDNIPNLFTSK